MSLKYFIVRMRSRELKLGERRRNVTREQLGIAQDRLTLFGSVGDPGSALGRIRQNIAIGEIKLLIAQSHLVNFTNVIE